MEKGEIIKIELDRTRDPEIIDEVPNYYYNIWVHGFDEPRFIIANKLTMKFIAWNLNIEI